ncbi:DUF4446 family protein [Candidatus Gottesmanbacteria bacterium]|nr:DUF4446 family protein [Candidatus Gottesmanbacteria bacterium]
MVFNLNQQVVSLILVILTSWLIIISFFLFKSVRHYNRLTQGTNKAKLAEVLEKILKSLEVSDQRIDELVKRAERAEKEGLTHIQKVGLLRFNPFEEVGGDQSFILALLNGENDGIVLTSLHSRAGSRWYGKTVKDGKGLEHELSAEEKEAIKKAEKVK